MDPQSALQYLNLREIHDTRVNEQQGHGDVHHHLQVNEAVTAFRICLQLVVCDSLASGQDCTLVYFSPKQIDSFPQVITPAGIPGGILIYLFRTN